MQSKLERADGRAKEAARTRGRWHILMPPEPGALLPAGPHSSGPERKHGWGLAERRETPFIYGHVWVWDIVMERGGTNEGKVGAP